MVTLRIQESEIGNYPTLANCHPSEPSLTGDPDAGEHGAPKRIPRTIQRLQLRFQRRPNQHLAGEGPRRLRDQHGHHVRDVFRLEHP